MSAARAARLAKLNQNAPEWGAVTHVETVPFGGRLKVERFRFRNGLELLACEDHAAPVVAYHTWFRVGSRHEREGKTGLAHLFEHLMFNEVEGRKPGEFDPPRATLPPGSIGPSTTSRSRGTAWGWSWGSRPSACRVWCCASRR
jgi:hypothetical protein